MKGTPLGHLEEAAKARTTQLTGQSCPSMLTQVVFKKRKYLSFHLKIDSATFWSS